MKISINRIKELEVNKSFFPTSSVGSYEAKKKRKVYPRHIDDNGQFNTNLYPMPTLTHKAPCIRCGSDTFIDWFNYPNKKKMLGCSICKTAVDIHTVYKTNSFLIKHSE